MFTKIEYCKDFKLWKLKWLPFWVRNRNIQPLVLSIFEKCINFEILNCSFEFHNSVWSSKSQGQEMTSSCQGQILKNLYSVYVGCCLSAVYIQWNSFRKTPLRHVTQLLPHWPGLELTAEGMFLFFKFHKGQNMIVIISPSAAVQTVTESVQWIYCGGNHSNKILQVNSSLSLKTIYFKIEQSFLFNSFY